MEPRSRRLTDKLRVGDLLTADCPSREVLKHVSSLWGVLCLLSLKDETLRFGELRRRVTGVSEKMLAQTLKRLEEDGFVRRDARPVVPPYVEYSLTVLGDEVAAHVGTLADWIELNLARIMDSRRKNGVN